MDWEVKSLHFCYPIDSWLLERQLHIFYTNLSSAWLSSCEVVACLALKRQVYQVQARFRVLTCLGLLFIHNLISKILYI